MTPQLTPAQLVALRADILADGVLNQIPRNDDGFIAIAAAYNALASPDFLVWGTNVPVSAILDAITWSAYTPNDTPDATVTFTNRALVVQTKQMNLQTMLQGRQSIDASKANIRAGLRDAVVAIPAGAAGASVVAGGASGATVLAACTRKATRAEKFFNAGSATTGGTTANLLGNEGLLSMSDVSSALAN